MENPIQKDSAGVIIFPPFLYIISLSLGLLLSYLVPFRLLYKPWTFIVGGTLLFCSLLLFFSAVSLFKKSKTTIHPTGSTTCIVYKGVYKHTRNPMYISLTLFYLGISIMLNAWISFFLLIPLLVIVQKGIVVKEEKYLTSKFGEEYLAYKKKVRRWL